MQADEEAKEKMDVDDYDGVIDNAAAAENDAE